MEVRAGGLDFDHPGFVHTVLVDFRARLAASDQPNRIFDRTVEVAGQAGLVGRKRVLDSAPIYDAVATQDMITLIRSAIRRVLRAADRPLRTELRAAICSGDGYTDLSKPVIDWSDALEREALVDSRAKDAYALLAVLDGRRLPAEVAQEAELLATVVGQDLECGQDGVFRIARRVAKDRVISTVDPQARHGHKTSARGFDGCKGHLAEDPDSEIVTATTVTAGNTGDADAAADLLADLGYEGAPKDSGSRSRSPRAANLPKTKRSSTRSSAAFTGSANERTPCSRPHSRPSAGSASIPVVLRKSPLRHSFCCNWSTAASFDLTTESERRLLGKVHLRTGRVGPVLHEALVRT